MQIFQIHVELNQHRFMLDAKKSNRWIIEEVYKNELYILRFSYNEVHFDAAFDDHQNTSNKITNHIDLLLNELQIPYMLTIH